MDFNNFQKILESFSISPPLYKKTNIVFELPSGDLVDIRFELNNDGSIKKIRENETDHSPEYFISERLGRLSVLARAINSFYNYSNNKNNGFVSPNSDYNLNWAISDESENGELDVCSIIDKVVKTQNPSETHVLYLTSNAGEGKTTIIEKMAQKYSDRSCSIKNRIIVPIPLAGKPFIRFDDLIIGSLVNQFKFSGYFFSSFIELVKLGYIIPAFDGFEEMFVESPTGAAISAMAEFIKELNNYGTIIVAARSAYYEYQSLNTQSKLYDSLSNYRVSFSKIKIKKWNEVNFIEYGKSIGFNNTDSKCLYDMLLENFGKDHPIITRAVLITKIYSAFENSSDISDFIKKDLRDYNDFYDNFIDTLLEREARKWLTKGKTIASQVLRLEQHKKLLAMIAREMWISKSEMLRYDIIEMLTDLFVDSEQLDAEAAHQVKNRIKDHAILKMSDANRQYIEFDHQDFYHFFLSEAILSTFIKDEISDVFDIARRGRLPQITLEFCSYNMAKFEDEQSIVNKLIQKMKNEQKVSYANENISLLLLFIHQEYQDGFTLKLCDISFETEPINIIKLFNVIFEKCIFSSLKLSNLKSNITFDNCIIMEIEVDENPSKKENIVIAGNTEVTSINNTINDTNEYAPNVINVFLEKQYNYKFQEREKKSSNEIKKEETDEQFIVDERFIVLEKALRVFFTRIEVNSDVLKIRLGNKEKMFWDNVYPATRSVIFKEVPYSGSGNQIRLRIICKMENIQIAMTRADGDFDKFISLITKNKN
jgi:hypothetical protein